MRRILLCLAILGPQTSWGAENLGQIYQLAKAKDSQINAAAASLHASQEILPQAKALLQPDVRFKTDTTFNQQEITTSFGQSGQADYNSHGYQLDLVQPLFHWQSWAGLKQAQIQFNQAAIDYQKAQQDLLIRVADAYFKVLGAYDNLQFAQSDKNAITRQRDQAKQRFELGLLAITSVHEAQSRYDLSVAREIVANNEMQSVCAFFITQ